MVALASPSPTAAPALPLGSAALEMHVTQHQLRTAVLRGIISPPKFGRYCAFPVAELAAYRRAMEAAGIVQPAVGVSTLAAV